jgi:hypothetical protein
MSKIYRELRVIDIVSGGDQRKQQHAWLLSSVLYARIEHEVRSVKRKKKKTCVVSTSQMA